MILQSKMHQHVSEVTQPSKSKKETFNLTLSFCDSLMDGKATGDLLKHTVALSGSLQSEQSLETFWII